MRSTNRERPSRIDHCERCEMNVGTLTTLHKLLQDGEEVSHRSHKPKIVGAIPTPASIFTLLV